MNLLKREVGGNLRVSLFLYGAHLYRYRVEDDPPVGRWAWQVGAEEALDHLDDLADLSRFPDGNPNGAMVEDMLTHVQQALVGVEHFERTALLTVGSRPPHPASVHPSEVLPCPRGHDWAEEMTRLERRRISFAAIYDRPASGGRGAREAWRRLGGGRPFWLSFVDAADVCRRLRLMPDDAHRAPLPFVVTDRR
ncbi:hypothetical protein BJF79_30535 [Actinomadura sp. CNU-125]|nr:hypothetical protein BJF79_30535 [Actinomadura sp. CNU-125]